MCPAETFIGTIESIQLTPNRPINFQGLPVSKFSRFGGGGITSCGGEGGGKSISYSSFGDDAGLTYKVFESTTGAGGPAPNSPVKGDLLSVNYEFNDGLRKRVYKVQDTE